MRKTSSKINTFDGQSDSHRFLCPFLARQAQSLSSQAPAKAGSKQSSPPGPRPLPLIGNVLDLATKGPQTLVEYTQKYGDIVSMRLGPQQIYLLGNGDLAKDALVNNHQNFTKGRALSLAQRAFGNGLLTSDGETYARLRKVMFPLFDSTRTGKYLTSVERHLNELRAEWNGRTSINLGEEMARLCIRISGSGLLDLDLTANAGDISQTFHNMIEILSQLNVLPEAAQHLPLPMNRRLARLRQKLFATTLEAVERKKRSGTDDGFVSALLEARLSDQEVSELFVTTLFAGYEAPSHALTWTFYLLKKHPEIEQKVLKEIAQALPDGSPTRDDVANLPYTRAVIAESMRLYPPIWVISRTIIEPYSCGGYTLPAGAEIFVSPYSMHRDPRYFPDPYEFNPDRWLNNQQESRHEYTYLPFGAGARRCIGERMAWPEMILTVATVMQNWDLTLENKKDVAPKLGFTYAPGKPIQMTIKRRTK